jgi:hypothetical protein
MRRLRKRGQELFIKSVHERSGVDSASSEIVTHDIVNWAAAMRRDFRKQGTPVKICDIPDDIISRFDQWDMRTLASGSQTASVSVRMSKCGMFGSPTAGGFMTDVYKESRRRVPIWDFANWFESDASGAESMYLANVRLNTLTDLRFKTFPSIDSRRLAEFIYAGKGEQMTPLHFDPTGNLVLCVRGEKWFRLFPPSVSMELNPLAGWADFFLTRLYGFSPAVYSSFRGDEPSLDTIPHVDFHLSAGEGLWMPPCWWHSVRGGVDRNCIVVVGVSPIYSFFYTLFILLLSFEH